MTTVISSNVMPGMPFNPGGREETDRFGNFPLGEYMIKWSEVFNKYVIFDENNYFFKKMISKPTAQAGNRANF